MMSFARLRAFWRTLLDNLIFLLKIMLGVLLAFGLLWLLDAIPWERLEAGRAALVPWVQRVETAVRLVGGVFVGTWSVRFLDRAFLKNTLFGRWGISRGQLQPFTRLITYSWTHLDDAHLFGNMPLLLLFTGLAALVTYDLESLLAGSMIILLVQTLGILFYSPMRSITAGASGMIWGYYGFSVVYGLIRGLDWRLIISILLIFLFWRKAYQSFTVNVENVSRIGHFWGFVGGCLAALWLTQSGF